MAKAKKRAEKRKESDKKQIAFDHEESQIINNMQSKSLSLYSRASEKFNNFLVGFAAIAKKFPILTILLLVIIGFLLGFVAKEPANMQGSVTGLPSVEYWYTSNATKLTDVAKQEINNYLGLYIPEYAAERVIKTPFFLYKDKQSRISIVGDISGVFASYYVDTKKESVLTYLVNKCSDEGNAPACAVILYGCANNDTNACKYNKTASDKIAELQDKAEQQMYANVTKSDKPKVELFVMSHCPYGKVGMSILAPVAPIFGDKIDASVKFVNYIMHGETERDDNTKIYCIQKEQTNKLWTYVDCISSGKVAEECMTSAGVDVDRVKSCMNATDIQFNITETWKEGGTYPRYNVNDAECKQYGVSGSPTLVINGQVINGDWRSPEKLKKFVCAGFNNPPKECEQALSDTTTQANGGCGA